ncbi:MAG: ABC transporter ATP-binding protein [Candidatus Thorarchaeota archaeon]
MSTSHISVHNLGKKFGKLQVLDQINLEVDKGEYVVILGPSGAGKTTFLKLIAGILKPSEGEIHKNGHNLNRIPPEKRNVAYLPQTSDYSLFPYMTVWENTVFSPKMKGEKSWDQVRAVGDEILDLVGLRFRYDALPYELSGGMKQRVALARCIAADADVFLLDEPLRALDARLRLRIRKELRKLAKDLEKTTFHVTHDFEEALAIADKVLIINQGRIEQYGTPDQIYNSPNSLFAAYFFGETNLLPGTLLEGPNSSTDEKLVKVGERSLVVEVNKLRGVIKSDPEKSDQVVIAIKAENILVSRDALETDKIDEENAVEGIINEIFDLGKFGNLEIQSEVLSKSLNAYIPSVELSSFEIGMKVTVSMPKDAIIWYHEDWDVIDRLEEV